jgi:hypothetical protein
MDQSGFVCGSWLFHREGSGWLILEITEKMDDIYKEYMEPTKLSKDRIAQLVPYFSENFLKSEVEDSLV